MNDSAHRIVHLSPPPEPVTRDAWSKLKAFTDARVGLGRAGVSLPTTHLLAFQLAHARAIDAVHTPLDLAGLGEQLTGLGRDPGADPLLLRSRAGGRSTYLQRPDHGRLLDEASARKLGAHRAAHPEGYDLAIAVVDGLSALAVEQNALPFLRALFEQLPVGEAAAGDDAWTLAPICLVEHGRVAIGDDICQRLNARCVLVLVGERPGLSSPDSLGIYLTWDAAVGRTDASRNCISNVRPAGLGYGEAARRTRYLLEEARRRQLSGVDLKDRSDEERVVDSAPESANFLVSSSAA